MHHSRYRLLLLALVLVLIGIFLRGMANKTEEAGARASGEVEESFSSVSEEVTDPPGSQARAGRSREGKALAKLRSLLKVRQGELAVIRIPARAALAESGDSILNRSKGEEGPTILHVDDVARFSGELEARVSQNDSVEGVVKAADGSFEWRLSDLDLKGEALPNSEEETTLRLELHLAERELVTTFTGGVGSIFVIHPGGKADALLLVLGGEKKVQGDGD